MQYYVVPWKGGGLGEAEVISCRRGKVLRAQGRGGPSKHSGPRWVSSKRLGKAQAGSYNPQASLASRQTQQSQLLHNYDYVSFWSLEEYDVQEIKLYTKLTVVDTRIVCKYFSPQSSFCSQTKLVPIRDQSCVPYFIHYCYIWFTTLQQFHFMPPLSINCLCDQILRRQKLEVQCKLLEVNKVWAQKICSRDGEMVSDFNQLSWLVREVVESLICGPPSN